ncbi:MAG: hypothetical protein AB8F74_04145 [Saprospiraceae bacterium]
MHFKDELDAVLAKHRGLVYHLDNNSLSGELFLPDGDSYEVQIKLDRYPELFPIVLETGGRIPNKMYRHIYTDTGSCCFTTAAKSQILLKTTIRSLLLFIDEIVIRYFENNSYYEINGAYSFEEYDHGSKGVVQSYQDVLGITDVKSIAKLIVQRLNNDKLRIRDLCYCKSGNTLKKCCNGKHSIYYRQFRMIDKRILTNDLHHFSKVLGL